MIAFTIYGVPVPQGSTRAFMRKGMKHPVVTHANAPAAGEWRTAVVGGAREALRGAPPIEGEAIEVGVVFYLPRPVSAPSRVVEAIRKPDVDKLVRGLLDGLTAAGVWRDDALVVRVYADKVFAAGLYDPLGARGVPRVEVVAKVRRPGGRLMEQRPLELSR